MQAIARAEDVRLVSDGADGWISVPDLKIPGNIRWSAYALPGHNGLAFHITFEREEGGKTVTTSWHGPHVIGGQKLFFVDAPKFVLQRLRDQLGASSAAPLVRVLRLQNAKGAAVRNYCKANGFRLIRNAAGNPVSVYPPVVICGRNPVDLDGDLLDDDGSGGTVAEEILDLEN